MAWDALGWVGGWGAEAPECTRMQRGWLCAELCPLGPGAGKGHEQTADLAGPLPHPKRLKNPHSTTWDALPRSAQGQPRRGTKGEGKMSTDISSRSPWRRGHPPHADQVLGSQLALT